MTTHSRFCWKSEMLIADDSHYDWYHLPMAALSLAAMRKGARGVVTAVADDRQSLGDSSRSTVSRRLLELGARAERILLVSRGIGQGSLPMRFRADPEVHVCDLRFG